MSERKTHRMAAAMMLFGRNWITLSGTVLSAASGLLIVALVILGAFHLTESPYLGIMAFLVLPGVFLISLTAIPAGVLWDRLQARLSGKVAVESGEEYPVVDFNVPHVRHVAQFILILTVVSLLIISTAVYQGVVFMESPQFCGKVCHTVMQPEFTAYSDSPHSRVACVDCHIGPGAPWFVRSKLSGLGQVLAVTTGSYERPIPTPVKNLRPSQDTCEQCHWPERFSGDRVKVITKFRDDEANTPATTVLLMHIGGGRSTEKGIHSWHVNPDKRTTYVAKDEQRQEILKVRVTRGDGSFEDFVSKEPQPAAAEVEPGEERLMDCIDCHNRPTHVYQLPAEGVDNALAWNRIDRSLPYIKKVGVEALEAAQGAAGDLDAIAEHVRSYYQKNYADRFETDRTKIEVAIRELQAVYNRNVFPDMKVTWGTYTMNLGHEKSKGCFRCHDDHLANKDGKAIGQDCEICHAVLAWDEENPEVLQQLNP